MNGLESSGRGRSVETRLSPRRPGLGRLARMTIEEFRRLGHALVDWIADYRERLPSLPVMSPVAPGAIRARFPEEPPAEGGRLAEAIAALDEAVVPGITHWNHPGFFAYFPSNTSLASVLGDLAAAGLGAQGMSWQTSPAATEVEEVVMGWLRQMIGLPASSRASCRTPPRPRRSCALLCARERTSGFSQNGAGLQGAGAPLVGLCLRPGAQLHREGRAARRVRQGTPAARRDRRRARAPARPARARDRRDLAKGLRPCALVAATGTTATTALDPVAGMAGDRRASRAVAARRRRARRDGDGAPGVPLDVGGVERADSWCSTRTSGWGSGSTSAPTSCAIHSTSCAS